MAAEQADAAVDPSDGELASDDTDALVQPCGFLLELSPDWLILRASENAHKFLRAHHVTLTGEPLASFTLAQALHDLRNSLSRQRSSSGIARAYRTKLIDDPRQFDIAFQLIDGRILLEGIAASETGFGAAYGSVSRLLDGLAVGNPKSFAEGAARRMRALTGFDRVEVRVEGESAESSRGAIGRVDPGPAALRSALIIPDTSVRPVPMFPRSPGDTAPDRALLRSPPAEVLERYEAEGVRSLLTVPIASDGDYRGAFVCTHGSPVEPNFEIQAAAELFAQVLAMRLQVGR